MTAEKKRRLGFYVFMLLLVIGFVASVYPAHHPEGEVSNSGDFWSKSFYWNYRQCDQQLCRALEVKINPG